MTAPVRVQLSRKKGWKMPENTVKVSRPGRWGNPLRFSSFVVALNPCRSCRNRRQRRQSVSCEVMHGTADHSDNPANRICPIQRSRYSGGGVHLLPLPALFADGVARRDIEKNRKRFLCSCSETRVGPRKHSMCAARDSGHFAHHRQRGPAIVLFVERRAQLPVEPYFLHRLVTR
jgi:hypothetical protein